MPRLMLNDEYWSKLTTIFSQISIYNKPNLRSYVEGMLYRIRVGCPWRDLPDEFGSWNSIYKKSNTWSVQGKWVKLFEALIQEPDMEWLFVDGSYVRAHQHSVGAAKNDAEAIGKSRGGNTTKIHLSVDVCGLPVAFEITGGEVNDCTAAPALLAKTPEAETIIADKGYDSKPLHDQVVKQRGKPIIPRRKNSVVGNGDIDWHLYKYRHLVENAFARLKHFRGIATRYDKLGQNFASAVALACAFVWLPM
ncbi:IS5 family transposase [Endozoicomonas acroporae]|uniref:IS5 family transposase n=1 Tax=Endozoicomonas acroporae TaxID=1701104 RepID=UPI003D790951